MKPSAPIGNSLYAPFFIRVALGAYFIMAGLAKLEDHHGFINEVYRLGALPEMMATLYGIVLPYLEVIAGLLFILGLWTVLAAIIISVMLASFIFAFGIFTASGPFNKDVLLLAAAVSVMYSGAGAFSVDRFRTSGG